MNTKMKLPIVGVMGSGSHTYTDLVEPLGRWLATLPVHLLTGGGRGVMASVSRAFAESSEGAGHATNRRGLCLGVLPGNDAGNPPEGYPNEWVELSIRTHLGSRGPESGDARSRNHVNVLTADVLVVLPGGPGTLSEVALAVRYGTPAIAWGWQPDGIPAAKTLAEVQAFVRAAVDT
jgi:uncharacterized protein (TIGR00725 family)